MTSFYFFAYTVGCRWGNNGIACKNLSEAQETARRLSLGDCFHAEAAVTRSVGQGADFSLDNEPLHVVRFVKGELVKEAA